MVPDGDRTERIAPFHLVYPGGGGCSNRGCGFLAEGIDPGGPGGRFRGAEGFPLPVTPGQPAGNGGEGIGRPVGKSGLGLGKRLEYRSAGQGVGIRGHTGCGAFGKGEDGFVP